MGDRPTVVSREIGRQAGPPEQLDPIDPAERLGILDRVPQVEGLLVVLERRIEGERVDRGRAGAQ